MLNKELIVAISATLIVITPALAQGPKAGEKSEVRESREAADKSKDGSKDSGASSIEPAMLFASAPGDELPKLYYLSPFDGPVSDRQPAPNNCACLIITKNGANLFLYPYKLGDLKELDRSTALKLFGKEDSAPSKGKYSTFHLLGFNRSEPNTYHLDAEFGDHSEILRYRVRGYGISDPKWQAITDKAVH